MRRDKDHCPDKILGTITNLWVAWAAQTKTDSWSDFDDRQNALDLFVLLDFWNALRPMCDS